MPRAKSLTEIGRELDAATGNGEATEVPGIHPPEGVSAQVETKVRYSTMVDPANAPGNAPRGFNRTDLEALAAEEAEHLAPTDPLSAFLEEWHAYAGYNCMVLRLPDPSTRRMMGQTYVRPHFGPPEQLGAITFDPNPINFVSTLQVVNQDSGGNFQLWLVDQYGQRVPDAILHSIAIADPPRSQRYQPPGQFAQPAQQAPQAPPARREESEEDKELRELRRQLMQASIQRMLNPAPPATTPATSALNPEDQAKLYLLGQAPQLFPTMFGQLAEMQKSILEASAAATNPATPTWQERGIEAVVSLAERNPAIIERLSGTLERIISLVLPGQSSQAQFFPAPQQQPQYLPQNPAVNPQQPPLPPENTAPTGADDEEDDPELMDILDRLITLLNSRKEITASDPVFRQLQADYPLKFRMATRLIASQPLEAIVEWVKTQSDLYDSLLSSEVTGPFLCQRIGELQAVFQGAIAGATNANANANTNAEVNTDANTETDTSETEDE